jgi:hypothetical protein
VHFIENQILLSYRKDAQDIDIDIWQLLLERIVENQWRSGSASDSNVKGSGFELRQGQGFLSSYETPEILGAGDSHVLRMRR